MENAEERDSVPRTRKKRHFFRAGCLIIAGFLVLFAMMCILLAGGIVFAYSSMDRGEKIYPKIAEETTPVGTGPGKIVRIDIAGIIQEGSDCIGKGISSDLVCMMLDKAADDPDARGIILYLNTPGGEVTAADTVYQKILDVRKKKPVVAYMSSIAASGGYYISCGCNRIIASRTALTGSIGVIISTYNFKDFADWWGIRYEVYKSGAMKDMLNPLKKRTREEEEIVQNLVDESYGLFLKLVSDGRRISVAKLRKSPACDGRILSAKEALSCKLIDRIGCFQDAVSEIEKAVGAPAGSLMVVRYQVKGSFLDMLLELRSPKVSRVSLELPGVRKETLPPCRLYYLPPAF